MKTCMLADPIDFDKVRWPLLGSVKLDGIRCFLPEGKPLTRSLKDIPNKFIRETLSAFHYDKFDGEIIVGDPAAKDCYHVTNSAVMSRDGEPDFTFWVFDLVHPELPYLERYKILEDVALPRVRVLDQFWLESMDELLAFEERCLSEGHEGIMLRQPQAKYKFGRSTAKGGELNKLKRFTDGEAEIIGFYEELKNNNEARINALGHTERSSHAENKEGKGTLGGFRCRELGTDAEFDLGGGFTAQMRRDFWEQRDQLLGKLVKFQHFLPGRKDLPRFPVFLGLRDRRDL